MIDQNAPNKVTYSKRATSREAHPVLFWFMAFVDAFILFLAIYYAILPLKRPYVITFHQQALAVAMAGAALAGGAVLVWRIAQHDRLAWTETEYAPPAPAPQAAAYGADERRELKVRTVRGQAVIVQPRAGAFVTWLVDTINPDNRVSFSQNEAKRREWEDWQYINLVAQLKGIGWLHSDRRINGAPDIDGQYLDEIKEWLKTPLLSQ
jgi:hypothetical protein